MTKSRKCKNEKCHIQELKVKFPGDICHETPDFLICGAGSTALPLAYALTNKGHRVLVLEEGLDHSTNPIVQYPFQVSKYLGFGIPQLNIMNSAMSPEISNYIGNPDGLGTAFLVQPVWSGRGVGGGGLHFLVDYVRPTKMILDGPLPAGIIPPNNTSTYSFREAGGAQWGDDVIQNIITTQIENYIGPTSECPSYRGSGGPVTITAFQPFPPPLLTIPWSVQSAMSNASTTVPGGAFSPIVSDYNCPQNVNSTSQLQQFLKFDGTNIVRQNSATAWANSSIVSLDNDGNLIGVNGRRLIILTDRTVVRSVKNKKKSETAGVYVSAGVEFLHKNQMYFVKAKNVIASMGAAYSPQFWMRSGIGPTDVLDHAKIPMEVNSPLIGKGLHNQFGPVILISSTRKDYSEGFFGQSFVQYNNVPRRWQSIFAGLGPYNYGVLGNVAYPAQSPVGPTKYYFYFNLFMCNPRSRGHIKITQAGIKIQPEVVWNYYSDGPDPNDPASGLNDPDSDITSACEFLDYTYNVVYTMRYNDKSANFELVFPPQAIFDIKDKAERHKQLVPYICMNGASSAHEAGTVVMNIDPTKGACDNNLKLFGTKNCFQCDFSIAPLQSSGNPTALLQAVGLNAADIIPPVAML